MVPLKPRAAVSITESILGMVRSMTAPHFLQTKW